MSVIKINKENFASKVLNSNKPVLLDSLPIGVVPAVW